MDGILIINKHKGCTSHDIVYKIKKITGKKVGHTGTLDPMARGVLPILIGKGTLCSKYLINHDKIYKATIQLGISTETMDGEGKITEKKEVKEEIIQEKRIQNVLKSFMGKQEQTPPIYSAIKVKGRKLYEYARKGQEVAIKPRKIEIYKINLIDIDIQNKKIEFEVNCSKGTYIRSLCCDIAKKIGTIGYMCDLERIQVGEFNLANSVTMEEIEEKDNDLEKYIIKIDELFKNQEEIELNQSKVRLFLNGVQLKVDIKDGIYKIISRGKFIGIATIKQGLLKRDIII